MITEKMAIKLNALLDYTSSTPAKVLFAPCGDGTAVQTIIAGKNIVPYGISDNLADIKAAHQIFPLENFLYDDAHVLMVPSSKYISPKSFSAIVMAPPVSPRFKREDGMEGMAQFPEFKMWRHSFSLLEEGGYAIMILPDTAYNLAYFNILQIYCTRGGTTPNFWLRRIDGQHVALIARNDETSLPALTTKQKHSIGRHMRQASGRQVSKKYLDDIASDDGTMVRYGFQYLHTVMMTPGKIQDMQKKRPLILPIPRSRSFNFVSIRPDSEILRGIYDQMLSDGVNRDVFDEFDPEPVRRPPQPIRQGHIMYALRGGGINGAAFYDNNGKTVVLRSYFTRRETIIEQEEREKENGGIEIVETALDEPYSTIQVLREDGALFNLRTSEEIYTFAMNNRDELMRVINERFKPRFPMIINSLMGLVLDNSRVARFRPDQVNKNEPGFPLFLTQELFTAAKVQMYLAGKRNVAITVAEPSFGKTPTALAAAVGVHVMHHVMKSQPELFRLLMKTPAETYKLDGYDVDLPDEVYGDDIIDDMIQTLKKYNPSAPSLVIAPPTMPLEWQREAYYMYRDPQRFVVPMTEFGIDDHRSVDVVIPRVIPVQVPNAEIAKQVLAYAQSAGDEGNLILPITTYSWAKLGLSIEAAFSPQRKWEMTDELGNTLFERWAVTDILANDPITGNQVAHISRKGKSANQARHMNAIRLERDVSRKNQSFWKGYEYTGIAHDEDDGRTVLEPQYRRIDRENGHALWKHVRSHHSLPEPLEQKVYGKQPFPFKENNHRVMWDVVEVERPARYGVQPVFRKKNDILFKSDVLSMVHPAAATNAQQIVWTEKRDVFEARQLILRRNVEYVVREINRNGKTYKKRFYRTEANASKFDELVLKTGAEVLIEKCPLGDLEEHFQYGDWIRVTESEYRRIEAQNAKLKNPRPLRINTEVVEHPELQIVKRNEDYSVNKVYYRINESGKRVYDHDPNYDNIIGEEHELVGCTGYETTPTRKLTRVPTGAGGGWEFINGYWPDHGDEWLYLNGVRPQGPCPVTKVFKEAIRDYRRENDINGNQYDFVYRLGDGDPTLDNLLRIFGYAEYSLPIDTKSRQRKFDPVIKHRNPGISVGDYFKIARRKGWFGFGK